LRNSLSSWRLNFFLTTKNAQVSPRTPRKAINYQHLFLPLIRINSGQWREAGRSVVSGEFETVIFKMNYEPENE
jgi:hypothetical protein